MNDGLKDSRFYFIVPRSYFRVFLCARSVFSVSLW